MAEIKFTGFVERKLGTKGIKVVESHRRKNPAGEWETVGRTFFTVWLGDCAMPGENDLIEVTGRQKTVAEDYNGEKRYNLHIAAEKIKVVAVSAKPFTGNESIIPSSWTPIEDAPF